MQRRREREREVMGGWEKKERREERQGREM